MFNTSSCQIQNTLANMTQNNFELFFQMLTNAFSKIYPTSVFFNLLKTCKLELKMFLKTSDNLQNKDNNK